MCAAFVSSCTFLNYVVANGEIYLKIYSVDTKDIGLSSAFYSPPHLAAPPFRTRCFTHTEGKKENPGLIKCLTVCVSSQFISLCLESITDVWAGGLLRAVTTTSKMRHTLQEEYEMLIKLVRLRISFPQLQRWELHCSQRCRLTPGLPHHTAPSQLPFSQ